MKKLFAMLALMGAMTFAPVSVMAQDAVVEEGGIHKELKTKYICGSSASRCGSDSTWIEENDVHGCGRSERSQSQADAL